MPCWVISRQLTREERAKALLLSRRARGHASAFAAQMCLREPIPDPSDPTDPTRFKGGNLIFHFNDIPALVWLDALTAPVLFALGLEEAQQGGGDGL